MCGDRLATDHLSCNIFPGNVQIMHKVKYRLYGVLLILDLIFQYIPHMVKGERHVFDRFAVIFSVAIVWIYAHLLTVGGAYKNAALKTQYSCRTDRAGIIGAAPW